MFKQWIAYLFWKMLDQRGEVEIDLEDSVDDDSADDDSTDDQDDTDSDDEGNDDQDDANSDDDSDDSDSDDEDPLKALQEQNATTQKQLEDAQKEINRLGFQLRKSSKEPDDKKDDEPQFTETQLIAMWEKHKDDPKVVYQIIKEMQTTAGKGIKADAKSEAEIAGRRTEIDNYITANYPDVKKEGTEAYQNIQQQMDFLKIDSHPYGDFLAIAASTLMDMPKIVEKIKEDAKKEILSESAETGRKKGIKNNKPAGSGKTSGDKTAQLKPSELETAKAMGFKTKAQLTRYAQMIKGSGTVTVA